VIKILHGTVVTKTARWSNYKSTIFGTYMCQKSWKLVGRGVHVIAMTMKKGVLAHPVQYFLSQVGF